MNQLETLQHLETMTDHELVVSYEQGVDDAFDVLLVRHQKRVFQYILRLTKDEEEANDIFQETFMRAVVCIRSHRYATTGKFSAWLLRVAHNLVVDGVRSDNKYSFFDSEAQESAINNSLSLSEQSCEEAMIREVNLKTISQLIDMLSPSQREIVHLRFYEGLSFKEIAQVLGISINTALGRVRYATIRLRKLIASYDLNIAI